MNKQFVHIPGGSRSATVSKWIQPRFFKPKRLNKVQKKQVKKIIEGKLESKYQVLTSAFSVTSSWGFYSVSGAITQGIQDSQRIGDEIMFLNMISRFVLVAGDTTNFVRILFFQWKEDDTPSGGPTAPLMFLNGVSGSPDYTSHYTHDRRKLFTVLYDRVFKLAGNGTAATAPIGPATLGFHQVKRQSKIKKIQYVGAGIYGINQLYVGIVADSSIVPNPQLNITTEINFKDA